MPRGSPTDTAPASPDRRHPADLRDGVSVIVPSYRGREHIGPCLRSLAAQTLDADRFEVVVVLNGEPDGTGEVLAGFRRAHPELNLHVHEIAPASAARARNVGIAAASRDHVTFVDDDDSVSPAYLGTLLDHAGPGLVPLAQIVEVDGAGQVEVATRINTQAIPYSGQTVHPVQVPRAVSFNACKLVPTQLARDIGYDPALRSGDDVVFFSTLLAHHDLYLSVCEVDSGPEARNAVYYRVLRPNSLSRQAVSFEFHVLARMEVLARLDTLAGRCDDEQRRQVVQLTMSSQASFISEYLDAHPDELDRVLRTVESYGITDFPYHRLTRGRASSLVVSYCFAPYSDPSGVVTAKRVRERGEIVDVVSNAMDSVRGVDPTTTRITEGLVDRSIRLRTPTRFSYWPAVEEFCAQGLARLEDHPNAKQGYQRLYSRVTWPASHFLAASYKARHPAVRWSAEFSDPVSHGIDGRERTLPVADGWLLAELRDCLRAQGLPMPATDNAFRWCEHLAFALADEVFFTNRNQLEYMLGYCGDPELVRLVRAKALVLPHPTLPRRFYSLVESAYLPADDALNLAYFGGFYASRGIDDVLVAIRDLRPEVRDRLRLHIFTDSELGVRSRVEELGVTGSTVVQPYAPYLEFLNLTTRFDWLVVTDARTADTHACNPYLPSKWSDYRGSGTPVWGLVEARSPLDRQPLDHRSPVGDPGAARAFLESIVGTRFPAVPRPGLPGEGRQRSRNGQVATASEQR